MTQSFSVNRRNFGHWDIYDKKGRIFRIRGGPGKYVLLDERDIPERLSAMTFKSLPMCMAFVTDLLMHELIIAEGQEPHVIESWNV